LEKEIEVLQYLINDRALTLSVDSINPFTGVNQILFNTLKQYYKKFKQRPSQSVFTNEIKKQIANKSISETNIPYIADVLKQLFNKVENLEYSRNEATRYLKRLMHREAAKKYIDLIESNREEEIYKEFIKIKSFGIKEEPDLFYFDVNREDVYKEEQRIPTLIPELDQIIGGIGRKELFIILSSPKSGKSIFLMNLGVAAVLTGYKVIYYTFEMSAKKVIRRFDSRFSGITHSSLPISQPTLQSKLEELKKKFKESLVIKEYPTYGCSVSMIEENLDSLASKYDFKPDMIITDYADIMRPEEKSDIRRFDLEEIYGGLRRIAGERNMAVVTASQGNRASLSKKVVTIADLSECYAKAFIADIIISMCQTLEEEEKEELRLYIAASRDTPKGALIPIKTNYSKMIFAV